MEIGGDGVCPVTGLQLQSIDLSPENTQRMIEQVQELALKGRDAQVGQRSFDAGSHIHEPISGEVA